MFKPNVEIRRDMKGQSRLYVAGVRAFGITSVEYNEKFGDVGEVVVKFIGRHVAIVNEPSQVCVGEWFV